MLTSQGAESQMRASIRNQIRTVEPQKMLTNVIMTQRRNFLQHKRTVSLNNKPVPPRVEDRISHLLSRSEQYKSSIQWQEGSNCMEATVSSSVDPTVKRTVKLSTENRQAPSCCAYSSLNDGFPCLHGTAVLKEKTALRDYTTLLPHTTQHLLGSGSMKMSSSTFRLKKTLTMFSSTQRYWLQRVRM